jgi:hypothetical protein
MNKSMKFGILCNSFEFEAWEVACIDNLLRHPQIELKLLVMNNEKILSKTPFIQKLRKYPYRNFLYRAYKRYKLKAASYKRISLESRFNDIALLNCSTIKSGKFSAYFSEQDIAAIKSHNLDFMLRFGFNIIKGEILKSCTYGVWSYHHADSDFIRGGPIGFWEIYLRKNTTAAVLQQLNEKLDQGKILRKGYLKTIDHCYAENIDQLTEMAAIWPLQVCIDLMNGHNVIEKAPLTTKKAKLFKYPGNWCFLHFIFILFQNKINFHFRQLFMAESWQIARYEHSLKELIKNGLTKAVYISKSRNETYCADPFIWPNKSVNKIVYEYFSYKDYCGKIAMSDLNGQDFKLLDFGKREHMSYPFLFEYNQQVYCLPEQAEAGSVTLYQIDTNGNILKHGDLIKDFEARDASLIYFQQKWWLFCTKANYFENAALFIFYADTLEQSFLPHQNNPVKVDVQNARPAGAFFIENEVLYRPAQNSALHYGHKVNINKITKLSVSEFEEEIEEFIEPHLFGDYIGIHHITSQQGQTIVDLKQTKFSLNNLKNQWQRKWRKISGKG